MTQTFAREPISAPRKFFVIFLELFFSSRILQKKIFGKFRMDAEEVENCDYIDEGLDENESLPDRKIVPGVVFISRHGSLKK